MTSPRSWLGRTAVASAALLAISTLSIDRLPRHGGAGHGAARGHPRRHPPRSATPSPAPSDVDARGTAAPTGAQRQAVDALGAVAARWNSLGTPSSLLPTSGSLGAAPGLPQDGARAWLRDHASVFGISPDAVGDLELVELAGARRLATHARCCSASASPATFHPRSAGWSPSGSRTARSPTSPRPWLGPASAMPAATLTPLQGWLRAATDLSVGVAGRGGLRHRVDRQRWLDPPRGSRFRPGAAGPPACPAHGRRDRTPGAGGQRRQRGRRRVTGLHQPRRRRHRRGAGPPQQDRELRLQQRVSRASITADACGIKHPFELEDDLTRTITALATGLPADDFVVKIFHGNTELTSDGHRHQPRGWRRTPPRASPAGPTRPRSAPSTPPRSSSASTSSP